VFGSGAQASFDIEKMLVPSIQWFSNFLTLQTNFAVSKIAADPFVWSAYFNYWEIRFCCFLAWEPQPPKQEANSSLGLAPAGVIKSNKRSVWLPHEHVRL